MLNRPAQNNPWWAVPTLQKIYRITAKSENHRSPLRAISNKGKAGFGFAHPTLCNFFESKGFIDRRWVSGVKSSPLNVIKT
jgi:hypothetical protein